MVRPQSPQNVRCFSPHCLHVYGTRTCPWAAETRFSAPHFAHLLSIRVLPRLIAMALRSIAFFFTKRSVSSRIACFDISRSLAFCKIGHRAGRRPQQRRCWGTIAHESVRNQPLGRVQPAPGSAYVLDARRLLCDALAESRVFVADGERVSTDQEARSRGAQNRFH